MKITSYICLVLLASMLLFGCGSSPDKTVVKYCKAIDAGKYDDAASYLSKEARQLLEAAGGKSAFVASAGVFKMHKGIKGIEIKNKKIAGDKADIAFDYSFNDGTKFPDSYPLVKEDGTWKISK